MLSGKGMFSIALLHSQEVYWGSAVCRIYRYRWFGGLLGGGFLGSVRSFTHWFLEFFWLPGFPGSPISTGSPHPLVPWFFSGPCSPGSFGSCGSTFSLCSYGFFGFYNSLFLYCSCVFCFQVNFWTSSGWWCFARTFLHFGESAPSNRFLQCVLLWHPWCSSQFCWNNC